MLLNDIITIAQSAYRVKPPSQRHVAAPTRTQNTILDTLVAAEITRTFTAASSSAAQLEAAAARIKDASGALFRAWNALLAARFAEPAEPQDTGASTTPSMYEVQLAIPRQSTEEFTVAILHARVRDETLTDPERLLAVLRDAITQWMNTTPEGRRAWTDSAADFNLGDLSNELTEEPTGNSLTTILTTAGIHGLRVETYSHDVTTWTFDTHLVDPDTLCLTVTCSLCHQPTPASTAHLHQGQLIGEECWDERLRASE